MVRITCRPSTWADNESAAIGWTSSWPGFGTTSSPPPTGPGLAGVPPLTSPDPTGGAIVAGGGLDVGSAVAAAPPDEHAAMATATARSGAIERPRRTAARRDVVVMAGRRPYGRHGSGR